MNIAQIRAQYPQYSDLSDKQLADALHGKFYSDLPIQDYYKRIGFAPETTVFGGAKELVKGLIPGAVGLVEQAAIGASALLPEQYETPTRGAIARVAGAAKEPFKAAAGYEETVGRKLGEAIGSTVPFLAAGPLGLAGRLGAVGLGVGAGAGEARTRAEKEGATAEQRALATALGIGPGALEVFAPFRILSRVPEAATAQGVQLVKRALIAGGEEAAQEAASGFAQNLIAKGIYKPEQELIEGLGEQAAYGGATGAIVQGLMDLALGRRARGAVAAPPGAPAGETPIERAAREAAEKAPSPTPAAPPVAETPAPPAAETPAPPAAEEPPAPETPAPPIEEPTVRKKGEPPATGMQPADIEALGIAKRQPIYRRMLGKDMDDPAQRDAVLADVEKYLIAGNGSEESRAKLAEFKQRFAVPTEPTPPAAVRSGEFTYLHGTETPDLKAFEPEYKGLRYDGDGGVFGTKGVYLDNTGAWTSGKMSGMYTPQVYETGVSFEKAFVLSPNTVDTLISELSGSPPGKLWGGKAITEVLRQKGYDGIIVEGFGPDGTDAPELSNIRAKLKAAKISQDITQDQVFAFYPERVKVLGKKAAPAEKAQREDYWRPNPYDPENKNTWQDTFGFLHYDVDYNLPGGGRVKDLIEAAQSDEIKLQFVNSKGEQKILAVYAAKGKKPYWRGAGTMTDAQIEAGLGSELYNAIGDKKLETEADYDALFAKLRSILTKPETPRVEPTEPEAGGAGAPVVSEPGAGAAPGGVGVVEPSGVVPVGEDVGKPVAGEGTEPAPVTPGPAEAAKPAEPAKPTPAEIVRGEYEPPVKAGLKPERERQLREKLAQQRKELAVLEAARDKAEGNIYLAEITGNEEAKARAIDAHEGARQVLKKAVTAADRTYAQLFDLEKADFEGSVGEAYVAELIAEREAKAKAAREKAPDTTKWPYTLTTAEAVREDVEFELPHSTPEYKAYIEKFFTPSRKLRKGVSEEDAVREGRDLLNRFVLVEARATTGAASEELTTAARNNDTLGALQIIRKMKDATPFDKLVAQRFENLGRYVGLPKIEVVPADQVKGDAQYDSGRDVVQIAEGQVDTHTVQHEIAHAFVHKIIVANEAGQRNDLGYRQLKKLFDHVQANHPELAGEYGMKSVSEFASEAMSNPEFQRALHKIKYQARTVWEAFTQAVRNLLNLAPGESTALVEAAASVDSLLRVGREFQVRETAGAGTVSVARAITPESEAAAAAADAIGEREDTSLTRKIGQQLAGNKALRLREKFADSLAPVEDFFVNAYGGQVRTASGRLNPMVLLSRALDALRVSKAVQLEGGLGREDGLIVATELKDAEGRSVSYTNILKRIADTAKENKKTYEEYRKTIDNVLYGHREYNLREKNKTLPADEQIELQLGDAKIDALEKAFQQDEFIKQVSADLDTIRFNLIDMLVETGRVSAEQAQDYKDATGYIPFQRIGDYDNKWSTATRGANRGVAALKQIRKLEGSKRQSASVVENFSGLVDWATKEAMKNEAASRALEDMVLMGAAKRGPKPATDSPGGVAEVYENGVKRQFYVPDPAHLATFSLADPQLSSILKAAQRASQVLRAGVTAMPPFAIKQVFDDVVRAYTYAGVKNNAELVRNVLTNFPKNWFNEVFRRKDEGIRKMERLGIVGTFDFTQQTNLKNVLEEAGAKKEGLGSTIMRVMEAGAKASDLAVRQAIYDQVMKETGDTAQAESAAREIINFSRRGSSKLMGQMISIIPFFNAYARGMDKLATAAAGKYVGKTTGTARAMFYHRMAVLTAMGFAYALMMQDDDKYNELPDHVRDTNWVLPYGKELGFTPVIPIPAELAFFFKAIPERIVRYYKYQGTPEERTTMDVLGELTKRGIDVFSSPNITPQVLRPFVENMANYSWFLGRPLESQAQLALRPFERYGTGTSDTMKLIARGLEDVANATGTDIFAVSPIKLENAVRGLMGTGAGMMLSFFDAIVNPSRTDRPLHQQLTPQLTGASALMKNAVGTRYMDEIYDLEKRVEQVNGTYNRLLKSDPEGADKFVRDNIGIYAIREPVKGIMDAIRTLNEAAMIIDRDTSLSPEERRKRIDELRAEQNEIARVVFTLRKQARDIQAGR